MLIPPNHGPIPRRLIFWDDRAPLQRTERVITHSIERLCRVCLESNRQKERNYKLCYGCQHFPIGEGQ